MSELVEVNEKYKALMDALNRVGIGIDIVNKNYEIIFQNKTLKEKFDKMSGKACYEKYMALNEPCDSCPMIKAINNNKIASIELKGSDGRYYEIISAPLPDKNGNIDSAAEIILDITEHKLVEQKLKESEEKYRDLFYNSPVGIFLFDENNNLIDGNTSAISSFSGYSANSSIGKNFMEIIPLLKNSEELFQIFIKRAEDQKKGNKLEPIEFKIIRQDGEERWVHWNSSKIDLHNKSIIQVVVNDISERKEAENLILEENKKLQELNKMRQELITRISHELKTPITSIYGASQALLEIYNKDMNEKLLDFVEIINRGGIRLKNLVENLLDSSRLESKKIELKLREENIVDIIRESVNDLKHFAEKRKLKIKIDLPDELLLKIDKIRFGQVITNILSNAINNTLAGGQVSIGIYKTSEHVDIVIKDTGVGITKEEKEKLFEKFGKIERFGKGYDVHIEGSGLGLYLSKQFVELHGGQIFVESEGREKGATFIIRLHIDKDQNSLLIPSFIE